MTLPRITTAAKDYTLKVTATGVGHIGAVTISKENITVKASAPDPLAPSFTAASAEGATEGHVKRTTAVTLTGTNLNGTGSVIYFKVATPDGTVRQDWTDVGASCYTSHTDTQIQFPDGLVGCLADGVLPDVGDIVMFRLDAGDHGQADISLIYEA